MVKTWPFLHYDEGKDLSYYHICVKGFKERKMKSRKILSFSAHFIKMTPSRAITNVNEAVEHDRAGAEWTPFVVMFLVF